MIAELHGKISSSGSNLSDRLEDKLTGDVFGALRYLPFQLGMSQILKAAGIPSLTECVDTSKVSFWGDRIEFWPYHELGEIDAFLSLDNAVVGIEVKYLSGLSSDDDVDNSAAVDTEQTMKESCNQLSRESRIVKDWATGNRKAYLVFIAAESACAPICQNAKERQLIAPGVELSYVSWEEILAQLSAVVADDPYQRQVLDDTVRLLKRKRFERFNGFDLGDAAAVDPDAYFFFEATQKGFSFECGEYVDGGIFYEYR